MAYVYPYKKYNYIVLIDSKEVGGFSEVNAGEIITDPIEYREDERHCGVRRIV